MPNKTIVPPSHCLNSCFFPEILNPISSTFPLQITKALKRNKMLETLIQLSSQRDQLNSPKMNPNTLDKLQMTAKNITL